MSDGDKSLDASGWSTMRGKKILVIIITLALLLACIIALRLRRDKPVGPSVSETSRLIGGPAFEVQVEMPAFNSGRAPWEIPGVILGYDHGPRFDQASPGAQVGKIALNHIELSADGGWDLLIETDGEGRLSQGTHVAFPVKLGGRPLKFNCRPADPTVGYLHTNALTGRIDLKGGSNWKSLSARMLSQEKLPRGPTSRSRFVGTLPG